MTGDAADDEVTVAVDETTITVLANGTSMSFNRMLVKRVSADAGNGDDLFDLRASIWKATIAGGSGDDRILGTRRDDVIDGQSGNDTLDGYSGSDSITGGDGFDVVTYDSRIAGFSFIVEPFQSPLGAIITRSEETDSVVDSIETFGGSSRADSFVVQDVAPSLATIILGRGGDDTFDGGENASGTFFGEAGNDRMAFGTGANFDCFGGAGNDIVAPNDGALPATTFAGFDGGPGIDTFNAAGWSRAVVDLNEFVSFENGIVGGNAGLSQVLIGTDEANELRAAEVTSGSDLQATCTIRGLGGDDLLIGGFLATSLIGGGGNDELRGGSRNDSIEGGDGDDSILGNGGNDVLRGNGGDDTLVGGPGRDKLYGGDGDDHFLAADGRRDTLRGGAGEDSGLVDSVDLISEVETLE